MAPVTNMRYDLDIRAKNFYGPSVRLLGIINKLRPRVELYCQLWFENSSQPVISPVTEFQYIFVGKEGGEPGNQPTNNLQLGVEQKPKEKPRAITKIGSCSIRMQ